MLEMWADLLDSIQDVGRSDYTFTPRKDVQVNEENGTLAITIELAGFSKDQVDIEIGSRTVTVTGETDKRKFNWNNTFPYELDNDSVKATLVNGILDISIEKKEKTSAKKIEIE